MPATGESDEPLVSTNLRSVYMLGTFGLRPKATLSARALGLAGALRERGWRFELGTTPWDHPADAGCCWNQDGVLVRNTHQTQPATWPLAVRELRGWVLSSDARLIHLFKPKGFGDLAARSLRRRYPVVVDMDDWEGNGGWNDVGGYGRLQRRVFDWQERSWPRQAEAVTVASRELERRAIQLGAPAERVHYLPNGLSAARVAALQRDLGARAAFREAHSLGEAPTVLLYTRFVEFDPLLVVAVLRRLLHSHPGARLVIAGGSADGAAETAIAAAAGSAGITERIIRLGWIDPTELGTIAAGCDLALHPFEDTVVNRAKCSVKLLELMATGIPVVSTGVGENRSFIEHGRSGLLASRCDAAALAALAGEVLDRPELAATLGQAGRERVAHSFLWQHLAPRAEVVYLQALQERGGGSATEAGQQSRGPTP